MNWHRVRLQDYIVLPAFTHFQDREGAVADVFADFDASSEQGEVDDSAGGFGRVERKRGGGGEAFEGVDCGVRAARAELDAARGGVDDRCQARQALGELAEETELHPER